MAAVRLFPNKRNMFYVSKYTHTRSFSCRGVCFGCVGAILVHLPNMSPPLQLRHRPGPIDAILPLFVPPPPLPLFTAALPSLHGRRRARW